MNKELSAKEKLRIAYEQLEKVKRGELPTRQGKKYIKQISQLEFLLT